MQTEAEISAWQRLRSRAAAEAISTGQIRVPYRCGCGDSSVGVDNDFDAEKDVNDEPLNMVCYACGRRTRIEVMKRLRVQAIKAIIVEGIDPRKEGAK